MKIITVNKPLQNKDTKPEDLELVEYYRIETHDSYEIKEYIPEWVVQNDSYAQLNPTESGDEFKQWLTKIEINIKRGKDKGVNIEGIYLYDIKPLYQELGSQGMAICTYISFAYIKESPVTNDNRVENPYNKSE